MNAMIDTLKYAKSFETPGFDKPQAEAIVGALADMASVAREDLVTKTDLKLALSELRTELKDDTAALRSDLQIAVSELRQDIQMGDAGIRGDLRSEIAGLRGELIGKIAESKTQVLWSMFGMQAFLLVALSALIKFTELFK